MPRIDTIFSDLRARSARGLMPFLCGGYPRPGLLPDLIAESARAGASIIEIGFPFSDPIADGPVIAAAMHEALAAGATPERVMEEIGQARAAAGDRLLGLVAMVSVSLIWRLAAPTRGHRGVGGAGGAGGVGGGRLIDLARRGGLDGFIIPDLPPEEGPELLAPLRDAGLSVSLLVAPTTPPRRAEQLVAASSGFVYLLARAGITGESTQTPEIESRVRLLRTMTDLPIACGFGISTPEHVRAVVKHADAAIVGTALVRRIGQAARTGVDPVSAAGELVRELAQGLT